LWPYLARGLIISCNDSNHMNLKSRSNQVRSQTTIPLEKITKNRLTSLGKKNQSYDNLVNEILDFIESSDQWWAERR